MKLRNKRLLLLRRCGQFLILFVRIEYEVGRSGYERLLQAGGKLLLAGIKGIRIDQPRGSVRVITAIEFKFRLHFSASHMEHCPDGFPKAQRQGSPRSGQNMDGLSKQNRRFASRADAMLRSRILRDGLFTRTVRAFPMTSRIRFLITAMFFCHLLLAPSLVTSQFLSFAGPSNPAPAAPNGASALQYQDVSWSAVTQELDGPMVKLHQKAEIHYGTYVLSGDEVTYNRDTGDSTVDGHVVLDGGPNDEHIRASHGTYNIRSESGRFESVTGTTGMRLKATRLILSSSNPFAFTGKVVVKTGPDHYLVYDGTITTCELPRPKWQFYAHEVDVQVGGNARIYNSTFRVEGVPILFFPFATHPVQKRPRQSGFLIPNAGRSSIKGYVVGESVFWAINPSMDALLGAEYFSSAAGRRRASFVPNPATPHLWTSIFSVCWTAFKARTIKAAQMCG